MVPKSKKSNIFNSEATVVGQCGDSITTKLTIKDNLINKIEQDHIGCNYTASCAFVTSSIVEGLTLEEALKISPEMVIKRIINLPKDHFHCARLAINSLGEAISKYYSKEEQMTKLFKSKNMLNIVVIAADTSSGLESFSSCLEKNLYNEVKYLSDSKLIVDAVENQSALLVVKDDSLSFNSVELIQKAIQANAFANIAIVSNDKPKKFENKFEGFGILMQLSNPPSEYETKMLCKKLHQYPVSLAGGSIMTNIAIFYCKRIKDHSCVGCAKCYKAIGEKNGEFGRYEENINLVSMTDCGDCPGLLIPRVKLVSEITNNIGQKIDVIHLGTCVKVAIETAKCPISFDELKGQIQNRFGVKTVLGTHSY